MIYDDKIITTRIVNFSDVISGIADYCGTYFLESFSRLWYWGTLLNR